METLRCKRSKQSKKGTGEKRTKTAAKRFLPVISSVERGNEMATEIERRAEEAEREAKEVELEAQVSVVRAQKTAVEAKAAALEERETAVKANAAALEERETAVKAKAAALEERENAVKARAQELCNQEAEMKARFLQEEKAKGEKLAQKQQVCEEQISLSNIEITNSMREAEQARELVETLLAEAQEQNMLVKDELAKSRELLVTTIEQLSCKEADLASLRRSVRRSAQLSVLAYAQYGFSQAEMNEIEHRGALGAVLLAAMQGPAQHENVISAEVKQEAGGSGQQS